MQKFIKGEIVMFYFSMFFSSENNSLAVGRPVIWPELLYLKWLRDTALIRNQNSCARRQSTSNVNNIFNVPLRR